MFFDGKDIERLSRDIDISDLDQIVKEGRLLEECEPPEGEADTKRPEAEQSPVSPQEQ